MSSIKRLSMTTPIGIARVKVDPDLELNGIFQNKYVFDNDRFDVSSAYVFIFSLYNHRLPFYI